MIPLLVPFVWLMFRNRRRYRRHKFYDHAVFVTYALSFVGMFAIAFTFLRWAGLTKPFTYLILIVLPVHMYFHLKGGYSLSRFSAIWRAVILLGLFVAVGGSFFFGLLLAGALS